MTFLDETAIPVRQRPPKLNLLRMKTWLSGPRICSSAKLQLSNVYVQVRAVTHFPCPEAFAKPEIYTPRKSTRRLGKDITRTNEIPW